MHRSSEDGGPSASAGAEERRSALVLFLALSIGMAAVALASLQLPQPPGEPGVVVTAVLLLTGSGADPASESAAE